MTIHTLDGRTALVTGGARGIGAAIVRRLHAEGANVVITDLLDAEGEALAAGLGQRALFVHHDVADEAGIDDLHASSPKRAPPPSSAGTSATCSS